MLTEVVGCLMESISRSRRERAHRAAYAITDESGKLCLLACTPGPSIQAWRHFSYDTDIK